MRGVFGTDTEGAVEQIDPALARSLSTKALGPTPAFPSSDARVVSFDWDDDGRVTHGSDLAALTSLETLGGSLGAALGMLASLARALRGLHALGLAHGDLGLDTVRLAPDGSIVILQPARRVPAGALLAARLRSGGPPSAVSFAAPEVVTGFEATPSSDVFSVAALAHRILMGQPPLGQIDFHDPRGAQSTLATLVQRSLAASPGARPSIEDLEAAFAEAAVAARSFAEATAGHRPYRDAAPRAVPLPQPPRSPAEASARRVDASSMSVILAMLLLVGGLFVFSGAVWLVAVNWDALGHAGRFALLALVTGGILVGAGAAGRAGYERSGAAMTILGVELLWADGAYVLDITGNLDRSGGWAALAFAMTVVAWAMAWARRSAIFGVLSATHFLIFAVAFGEAIKQDTKTGPALYWLAVALAYAAIAAGGDRARGALLGMPFAVGACLAGWVSAVAGLALIGDDATLSFGAAWPYAVVLASGAIALAAPGGYRVVALVSCGGVVALAPTTEAIAQHERFAFLVIAIALGFAFVVAAFKVGRVARRVDSQIATAFLGVLNATLGTTILFLMKCIGEDGLDALSGPHGRYLVTLVAVSALLVGCSYAFGRAAAKKESYRIVELGGLAQFFGAFTIASLARYDDWFYPGVCLAVGGAVLGLGVATRRASLVVFASSALVANLFIQYFEKLRDRLPVSVLVIGFGLGLLASGVLYERRLKRLLPRLRTWD